MIRVWGKGAPERGQIGPYPRAEAFGVVWRNIFGPSHANLRNIQFTAKRQTLNAIDPVFTLGLGGDVMMMYGRALSFAPDIQQFFADCDAVLLNMEGVITDLPKSGPQQKHDRHIIDALNQLGARQLWLSLANNHAGDFGMAECLKSQQLFKDAGFHCFGLADSPYADIHPSLRVITGTQWSNHPCPDLAWLDEDPTQHRKADAFNLLFPHWSYEMEYYPRPWAVDQMHTWLDQFDAVIGHHSHTPQPITIVECASRPKQVAAYSLGDLCFGLAFKRWPLFKHYPYGLVMKMQIGRLMNQPEQWAVGAVEWSFTDTNPVQGGFCTSLTDSIPAFKF